MHAEKRTISLTRYFIPLPSPQKAALLVLLVGCAFGILSGLLTHEQASVFNLGNDVGLGIFLVSLPSLISGISLYAFRRVLTLKRILSLCFLSSIFYAFFYLAGSIAGITNAQWGSNLVFIGYGLSFILWYAILRLGFGLKRTALPFSMVQLLFNAAFLLGSNYIVLGSDPFSSLIKFYFASGLLLLATYLIFWLINAPMKKSFGVSSTEAITLFASQWLYRSNALEEKFEDIGNEVHTQLALAAFRTRHGTTYFAVPYVHFGPFGSLGGSEFSYLLKNRIERMAPGSGAYVFHGTVTHDFNPVSSGELDRVSAAFLRARSKLVFKEGRMSFAHGKSGACRTHLLSFSNFSLLGLSRAPLTTEDVNYAVGCSIMNLAERDGHPAIAIDEHNSETGEVTSFEPGSPEAHGYESAVRHALSQKTAQKPFRFSSVHCGIALNSIGSAGISLALFESGKSHYCLILMDSNGIEPAMRRYLIDELTVHAKRKGIMLWAEIFTTDTHQLNAVKGVLNPLSWAAKSEVTAMLKGAFDEACSKLAPAQCAAAKEPMVIKVIGSKQSTELVSTVNSIIAMARVATPIILLGTMALLFWALSKI
jgi:putative membrane protein